MGMNAEAALDDRTMYFLSDALYALDRKTGSVRWRHALESAFPPVPDVKLAAGGGHCFLQSGDAIAAVVAPTG